MLITILFYVAAAFILLQIGIRVLAKTVPFPCPVGVVWILESPVRKRVFGARKTLSRIGIQQGEAILEIGPGSGYLTVGASKDVGDSGRLYCLDIQSKMIEKVRQKVLENDIANVQLIVSDARQLPFKQAIFHRIFLVTVLGEIRGRSRALDELYRVVRSGGIVSFTELLPDPHYLSRNRIRALCKRARFAHRETQGTLFQYTANFTKP